MDNLSIHSGQTPRLLRGAEEIQHAGYLPAKQDVIDWSFDSFNYSFILSGGGFYSIDGRRVQIKAPCVLTQWPGVHFHYGQDEQQAGWEELFFIFPKRSQAQFQSKGMWRKDRPWWPIAMAETTRRLADEVTTLMKHPRTVEVIDLLDRLAEAMVVASLGANLHIREKQDERSSRIAQVREDLAENPRKQLDWEHCAHACGCSLSTFRRLWIEQVGIPPQRYVMQIRIQEAARMLLETDLTIADIAAAIGVEDPLYFSRLFRQQTGESPTLYRENKRTIFAKLGGHTYDA
ncbi:MAG: helix-turn-helix transcriptional regulator [Puniceicoccales bacterium]